jgi:sporulation integral membrane protein YlbJ
MKVKKLLIYTFAAGAVILLVTNGAAAVSYASDALGICFEMIVPSLFPFFVCSGILIYSGFCEQLAKLFRFCMYPLFRVNPMGSSAFVLGIVSGYPLGAVTAGELYANGYLSKTEAERLLAFCNNSGPLFILTSVGIAVYSNIKFGIALYLSHILAALTVGVLFRFYGKGRHTAPPSRMTSPERSFGEVFDIALQNGIKNILTVCGAVVFFSVISRILLDIFPLNDFLYAVMSGFFEFVTGTVNISRLSINTAQKLILTAVTVGFAGLSVHAQVMAVIARYRLSLVPYIVGKILHAVIAGVYMALYLYINPISTAVFKPSMGKSFASSAVFETGTILFVLILCALCVWVTAAMKKRKVKK